MNLKEYLPAFFISLLFAISFLAPRSMAFLPYVVGVAGYIHMVWQTRSIRLYDPVPNYILCAILVLGFASILWAIAPASTMIRAITLAGLFAGGMVLLEFTGRLEKREFPKVIVGLAIAYAAIGCFLSFEYAMSFPLMKHIYDGIYPVEMMNRTTVIMMLLFLPLVSALWPLLSDRKSRMAITIILFAITAWPLWKTQSQAAQLGFCVLLLSYVFMRLVTSPLVRRITIGMAGTAMLALFLTIPLLFPTTLILAENSLEATGFIHDANVLERLEIWSYVSGYIHAQPWLGYGLEALQFMVASGPLPHNGQTSFLHPHNTFLQVWLEMGIVGVLLAGALLAIVIWRISRSAPEAQPLYTATLSAFFIILFATYGLWQSWFVGFSFTLIAITRFAGRSIDKNRT